jgi:hypothetical protein
MRMVRHTLHFRSLLVAVVPLLTSCTKDITLDLPAYPEQLVVEGIIEPGTPPYVILTHTESYTANIDANALANIFVTGATVTVTTDGEVWVLDEWHSDQLDPASLAAATELLGVDPSLLSTANICIYSTHDPAHVGVIGKTYRLNVSVDGKSLSAVSSIPNAVPLDSVWVEMDTSNPYNNASGHAWVRFTDPDTVGNGYRWMEKSITYSYWFGSDPSPYIARGGSSFSDKFINGLTVDLNDPVYASLNVGDTIAVKWLSIGKKEYEFYSSFDNHIDGSSNPFGTPASLKTNITGGLGIWAGRGVYLDTVVCVS